MPRGTKKAKLEESRLSKGQTRKLNALRKSLGPEIADRAFAEWMEANSAGTANGAADRNADLIASELMRLVEREGIQIPRGGYLVRRGRGRVIVEPGAAAA